MTDKDKIRAEVERLMNELIQEKEKGFGSDIDDACILELQNVLTFIDSLQEDSIEYNPFDDFRHTDSEEPVREVFENALAKEWKGYNDRGAATVDALEDNMQKPADNIEPKFKVGQKITDGKETVIVSELLDDGSIRVDTKPSGDCWFDIDVNEADKWRLVEEPISEDLLDEIHNRWEDDPHTKWPKCPYKDFKNIACHFANWQRKQQLRGYVKQEDYVSIQKLCYDNGFNACRVQMMNDAVDGITKVDNNGNILLEANLNHLAKNCDLSQRVKLIIIKEE